MIVPCGKVDVLFNLVRPALLIVYIDSVYTVHSKPGINYFIIIRNHLVHIYRIPELKQKNPCVMFNTFNVNPICCKLTPGENDHLTF